MNTKVITKLDISLEENILLKNLIENVINSLIEMFQINVEYLDRLVFTSQFDDELKYLIPFTRFKTNIQYTKNSTSSATAKVVEVVINNEIKFIIVCNELIPSFLQSSNENDVQVGIHLLHHELSHIHDYYNLREFDKNILNHKFKPTDRYYFNIAYRVWSEFFANYNSIQTISKNSMDISFQNFKDGLSIIDESILLNKLRYQKGLISLDEFDFILLRDTLFLYSMLSYLLGYLASARNIAKDPSIKLEGLEGHFFEDLAQEMLLNLEELLDIYPSEWKDISIFDKLKTNIFRFYEKIGIAVRNVYVDGKENSYMQVDFTEYDLPLDTV